MTIEELKNKVFTEEEANEIRELFLPFWEKMIPKCEFEKKLKNDIFEMVYGRRP